MRRSVLWSGEEHNLFPAASWTFSTAEFQCNPVSSFSNASVASAHASSGVEAGALPAVSLARFPGLDRHASRCKIRLLGFVERSDEPKDDEGSSCCSFGPTENPLLDLVHMRIDPGSDDRRKTGVRSINCP